uniref:Similar to Callose synthase 3 n=1 Tax=Arundo donax TaxID=35708 RepID=A0A0A9TZP3_ARUDO
MSFSQEKRATLVLLLHFGPQSFWSILWTHKFGIQSSPLCLVEFMVLFNDLERFVHWGCCDLALIRYL